MEVGLGGTARHYNLRKLCLTPPRLAGLKSAHLPNRKAAEDGSAGFTRETQTLPEAGRVVPAGGSKGSVWVLHLPSSVASREAMLPGGRSGL